MEEVYKHKEKQEKNWVIKKSLRLLEYIDEVHNLSMSPEDILFPTPRKKKKKTTGSFTPLSLSVTLDLSQKAEKGMSLFCHTHTHMVMKLLQSILFLFYNVHY